MMAIVLEDFASSSSTASFSAAPLQFLVKIYSSGEGCNARPTFTADTPIDGTTITVPPGQNFTTVLSSSSPRSGINIQEIQTVSPLGAWKSPLSSSGGQWSVQVDWTPSEEMRGRMEYLCFMAIDSEGLTSELRCIRLHVTDIVTTEPPTTSTTTITTTSTSATTTTTTTTPTTTTSTTTTSTTTTTTPKTTTTSTTLSTTTTTRTTSTTSKPSTSTKLSQLSSRTSPASRISSETSTTYTDISTRSNEGQLSSTTELPKEPSTSASAEIELASYTLQPTGETGLMVSTAQFHSAQSWVTSTSAPSTVQSPLTSLSATATFQSSATGETGLMVSTAQFHSAQSWGTSTSAPSTVQSLLTATFQSSATSLSTQITAQTSPSSIISSAANSVWPTTVIGISPSSADVYSWVTSTTESAFRYSSEFLVVSPSVGSSNYPRNNSSSETVSVVTSRAETAVLYTSVPETAELSIQSSMTTPPGTASIQGSATSLSNAITAQGLSSSIPFSGANPSWPTIRISTDHLRSIHSSSSSEYFSHEVTSESFDPGGSPSEVTTGLNVVETSFSFSVSDKAQTDILSSSRRTFSGGNMQSTVTSAQPVLSTETYETTKNYYSSMEISSPRAVSSRRHSLQSPGILPSSARHHSSISVIYPSSSSHLSHISTSTQMTQTIKFESSSSLLPSNNETRGGVDTQSSATDPDFLMTWSSLGLAVLALIGSVISVVHCILTGRHYERNSQLHTSSAKTNSTQGTRLSSDVSSMAGVAALAHLSEQGDLKLTWSFHPLATTMLKQPFKIPRPKCKTAHHRNWRDYEI
ncbi:flocculation protein FLO11-like isoform X1 [Lingula anatina]|uniref:Flocculation protein FLO11-like isoform X1 n=1 Tax=Lingula anatina TaxID=7574 RepID=A0A1S3I0P6_LINAN|nr:flocculation protein FLO11-like isoform X1 [Lingula anatina]|eukprot:XP_013391833.1 flocculation protein FLO11-like isoform X1 [Lingula anatina]